MGTVVVTNELQQGICCVSVWTGLQGCLVQTGTLCLVGVHVPGNALVAGTVMPAGYCNAQHGIQPDTYDGAVAWSQPSACAVLQWCLVINLMQLDTGDL